MKICVHPKLDAVHEWRQSWSVSYDNMSDECAAALIDCFTEKLESEVPVVLAVTKKDLIWHVMTNFLIQLSVLTGAAFLFASLVRGG